MAGCRQEAEWFRQWRAAGMPDWRQLFEQAGPRSHKVRCIICGSKGYDGMDGPSGWQVTCLRNHAEQAGVMGG